jgi:uncharacterized protein YggU (UPF0235/DUF167 family)
VTEPWIVAGDSLRLTVRLTPRSGRDAIDGVETLSDGRPVLKCRVRVAPSDGEANAALISLLARELDLPRAAIALVSGATARLKTVALTGDARSLVARLQARTAPR